MILYSIDFDEIDVDKYVRIYVLCKLGYEGRRNFYNKIGSYLFC